MKPYYQQDGITIFHGDCREILPALQYDCILSDPPWGSSTKCNAQRFTRASSAWWKCESTAHVAAHKDIKGDSEPFDPKPFIDRPSILWGANWFCRELPQSGGWLVWDKRIGAEEMAKNGWPLSEAELAWTNVRGSVRVFRNLWSGLLRSEEQGEYFHPTQKPIRLMEWCIRFLPAGSILDPYMGSGTTLVAAKQSGRIAIGIEFEESYCEIAARRLAQGVLFGLNL